MKDYAPKDYLKNRTPRQHAVELFENGIDWDVACNMAGYDERAEVERTMQIWLVCVAVLCVVAIVVGIAS